MRNIAIIGFGNIGGGITAVIEQNAKHIQEVVGEEVYVKYILDLREFPDSPYGDRVVHNIETILEDKSVELVCETMGGSHPAFEYSCACMEAGKSVVTSNKEVVANFGDKLLETAKNNNVMYRFEASVGGGIPIIHAFLTTLSCDTVNRIDGILNGTTNYMLTKMREDGITFDKAVEQAQQLGYAERNPANDVEGTDSKRKIVILAALVSGILSDADEVYCEGITKITQQDNIAAGKINSEIKLLATAEFEDESGDVIMYVCPQIVPNHSPLSSVHNVYNGIVVNSPVTGDIMYYGQGAGRFPTAGAVVNDIVSILSGAADRVKTPVLKKEAGHVVDFHSIPFKYYIRATVESKKTAISFLKNFCDTVTPIDNGSADTLEVICGDLTMDQLNGIKDSIGYIQSIIRVVRD